MQNYTTYIENIKMYEKEKYENKIKQKGNQLALI